MSQVDTPFSRIRSSPDWVVCLHAGGNPCALAMGLTDGAYNY
jgi:hypothetical protein